MLHVFELGKSPESSQMLKAKPRTPWLSWNDQNLSQSFTGYIHILNARQLQNIAVPQRDQPNLGGNFKSSFYLLFPEEVIWKNSKWIQNRGITPLGQASPQSYHLYNHYNSHLFTKIISTEMQVTQQSICKRGEADSL